jgi:hypothetical protein
LSATGRATDIPSLADLRKSDPGLIGVSNGPMFVVTPHDATNFTDPARYLMVTAAGNVAVVNLDDSVITIQSLQPGNYIMGAVKRVNATNTTVAAGNIIGYP